jgi:hypothetical protein
VHRSGASGDLGRLWPRKIIRIDYFSKAEFNCDRANRLYGAPHHCERRRQVAAHDNLWINELFDE